MLVESCLSHSPSFAAADALVNASDTCTSAHALAEAYATVSGDARLRIAPADAAHMIKDLAKALSVEALSAAAYQPLISAAPAKGIRGGMIYDALHSETARKSGCQEIHTLNVSHFRLVAPDLAIVAL